MKALLLTGPSGSGKTTIAQLLLQKYENLAFSISATTRPPRTGEVHGKDYYFLSEEEFDREIEQGGFVEWERLFSGYRYGTLYRELERIEALGKVALFVKDVKGALSLKKVLGEKLTTVFLVPPSIEALRERLLTRGISSVADLEERLVRAEEELRMLPQFDFVLYNDEISRAVQRLERHIIGRLL
ncbi:MAG: guanylate kinase [Bacteroidia bacterium]|nr:guanylate kinase [Bacteroidia bacterium]MCX7764185.1 guanylate kinase [Bacteroidia bacterium]MDW8057239.1 guanylate kinase [Bacteroidia bacterium]